MRKREGVEGTENGIILNSIYIIVFRNKLFCRHNEKQKFLTQALICYRIIDILSEGKKNDSFYCFYYSNNDDDGFELSCSILNAKNINTNSSN